MYKLYQLIVIMNYSQIKLELVNALAFWPAHTQFLTTTLSLPLLVEMKKHSSDTLISYFNTYFCNFI